MPKLNKETVRKLVVNSINEVFNFIEYYYDDHNNKIIDQQKAEVLKTISFIEEDNGSILFTFVGLLFDSFNYAVFDELSQTIVYRLEKAGYYYEMKNPSTLCIYKA